MGKLPHNWIINTRPRRVRPLMGSLAHTSARPGQRTGAMRGFTLVEVLMVVVILGLIGGMVVPQMLSATGPVAQAATRSIVGDLTYAQNEAIARQAPITVVFRPQENRYELRDGEGNLIEASWKGGEYVVDFDDDTRFEGVSLTAARFDDAQRVTYDEMGAPSTGGTVSVGFNERQFNIDVAAFTGRVTVERDGS